MTNLEDALFAVDAGADAVGFVFYEKSPRYVTVETAKEIVEKLPKGLEKVGVFARFSRDKRCRSDCGSIARRRI
jgi:phosphoribosylanthranilate isomerase